MMSRPASSLIVGDTFRHRDVMVTVLEVGVPCRDRFGRDMIRLWCRREDTGAEGWIVFGPDRGPT